MPLTPLFSSSTPLLPLYFGLCDINAAIFEVLTPLTPLFFRLNAVNAAVFPVKRRYRRSFTVQHR